jgi:hypothetical protein
MVGRWACVLRGCLSSNFGARLSAGAEAVEFPTRTTRLSQVGHHCGTVEKKPLSQRWHDCDCGIAAQRDLYSAFLAMWVEEEAHQEFGLNVGKPFEIHELLSAVRQAAARDGQE